MAVEESMKVRLAVALFLLTLACPVVAQEPQTANTLKAPAELRSARGDAGGR